MAWLQDIMGTTEVSLQAPRPVTGAPLSLQMQ